MAKTTKVTRTEANDVISRHAVLSALRTNTPVTLVTIEEEIEAFANNTTGVFSQQWAKQCNPRSAYRLAVRKMRARNREDLTVQLPSRSQVDFLGCVALAGGKNVGSTPRRNPSCATVLACREQGWIAPYEGPFPVEETVSWAPWTITDAGRDAAFGMGNYRR